MKTPILLTLFNRPECTVRVIEKLRTIKPKKLYISCDAPRVNSSKDLELVNKVKEIVNKIDWECEVKKKYNDTNLGCKYGPVEAKNWFFTHEEQGIILEDDDLPNDDFFKFCEEMLLRYKNNENIWAVNGTNYQSKIIDEEFSYYFSDFFHPWGWATWRRAWIQYDHEIKFWPSYKTSKDWVLKKRSKAERNYWENIFDKVYDKKMETAWDYSWQACMWRKNAIAITPRVNLVTNIGFGDGATHTGDASSHLANMKTNFLGHILHPTNIEINKKADRYLFDNLFNGKWLRFPWSIIYFPIRVFRSISRRISDFNLTSS